jgi:hypothetical protein
MMPEVVDFSRSDEARRFGGAEPGSLAQAQRENGTWNRVPSSVVRKMSIGGELG